MVFHDAKQLVMFTTTTKERMLVASAKMFIVGIVKCFPISINVLAHQNPRYYVFMLKYALIFSSRKRKIIMIIIIKVNYNYNKKYPRIPCG